MTGLLRQPHFGKFFFWIKLNWFFLQCRVKKIQKRYTSSHQQKLDRFPFLSYHVLPSPQPPTPNPTYTHTASLWCVVSSWCQQRSHLPCMAAAGGMGPAPSLVHVYFKGVEPFADWQWRLTASPTSSPPSTQHLGTDGFAGIQRNVKVLFI